MTNNNYSSIINTKKYSMRRNNMDERYFIHPNDAKALDALKSLPAFPLLCKKFNEIFTERQYKVINLSSHLRLSEDQLPEIWSLLPPICEKLGIDVPELYLEQNPTVNAYTFGDTNPFICLHTGLINHCDVEVIKAVIAHECGHIACHHTLYKSLANFFLGFGSSIINIPFLNFALKYALLYWDRCAEYSADRAAAFACGGSSYVVDTMKMLAGGNFKHTNEINSQEMLLQANEFENFKDNSGWNKFLMYYALIQTDHPFVVDRASDIVKWCDSDDYKNLCDGVPYADSTDNSKNCPNCNSAVDSDAKFCMSCGAKIKHCTNCGSCLNIDDKFCGKCGYKFSEEE